MLWGLKKESPGVREKVGAVGAKEKKGRGFGKSWENSNMQHRRFQASSHSPTLQF
jgi:hypothetical protein